jgi:hypothetical protein
MGSVARILFSFGLFSGVAREVGESDAERGASSTGAIHSAFTSLETPGSAWPAKSECLKQRITGCSAKSAHVTNRVSSYR